MFAGSCIGVIFLVILLELLRRCTFYLPAVFAVTY
jgi:hypothetical protein